MSVRGQAENGSGTHLRFVLAAEVLSAGSPPISPGRPSLLSCPELLCLAPREATAAALLR